MRIVPTPRFGQSAVRAVRAEVLAEQYRAGDPIEMIAALYELDTDQVLDALDYERSRLASLRNRWPGGTRFYVSRSRPRRSE